MVTAYSELFRIDCLHGYFAAGRCGSLSLAPTAECARLLDRYGCIFRATVGGGTVYSSSPQLLAVFNETVPFAFDLISVGPELMTCTEIAPSQTATPGLALYYFSNLQDYGVDSDPGPDESGEAAAAASRFLHPPNAPFSARPLPVKPAQFTHCLDKPAAAGQARILDALGREVRLVGISAPALSLPMDLSRLPNGRYRLKIDGADDDDFYLSGPANPQRWGVVEIFPGGPAMPSIPQPCRVLQNGAALSPPVAFVLSLPPRQSRWRYYIVSQSPAERAYDDYRISVTTKNGNLKNGSANNGRGPTTPANNAPEPEFLPAGSRQLNGQAAWIFESAEPIPHYEYPSDHYEFSLLAAGKSGGVSLPYGSATAIRMEKLGGLQHLTWVEIYVYL